MSLIQNNSYPCINSTVSPANQSEYRFETTHHPEQSNVYQLKLVESNDQSVRIHQEMRRICIWRQLEINFNKPIIPIYPVLSGGDHYLPEVRFYLQIGNKLFGEDAETNRCIYGRFWGPFEKNSTCIPTTISLSVSKIRFDNINLFNYPTVDHTEWEMALKKKWNFLNTISDISTL